MRYYYLDNMKYPKLHPDDWLNSRLTVEERTEVDYYINHAGWSLKRVSEMYGVSQMTIKYWSDADFREKDILRATARIARKMENPEYKREAFARRKIRITQRREQDAMYNAWVKHAWRDRDRQILTATQRERQLVNMHRYYTNNTEKARERGRRSYHVKNNNGFRQFMNRVDKK